MYVEHASSSDSDTEESESEEEEVQYVKSKKERNFTSQRNKKSLVKVHKEQPPQPPPLAPRKFINYFVD